MAVQFEAKRRKHHEVDDNRDVEAQGVASFGRDESPEDLVTQPLEGRVIPEHEGGDRRLPDPAHRVQDDEHVVAKPGQQAGLGIEQASQVEGIADDFCQGPRHEHQQAKRATACHCKVLGQQAVDHTKTDLKTSQTLAQNVKTERTWLV